MSCRQVIVQRSPRPVIVQRTARGTVVVHGPAHATTVEQGARSTVVVREERTISRVEHQTREIDRVTAGPQGPRGFPGGSIPPIPFSFGDAGAVRYSDPAPGTYTRIRIDITTPFNGADPRVSVGFVGDVEALMTALENDPLVEAGYETTTDLHVAGATGVWLGISPSGSTQGAGVLYLEFLPD